MLIENLQSVISQEKESRNMQPSCSKCKSVTTNLTSHSTIVHDQNNLVSKEEINLTSDPSSESTIPGLCETTLKLKGIGLHGVAFDGLLLWIDTKRRTIPEDSWKEQVLNNFTAEEITDAKNVLWDVANAENLLGRNIVRKGDSKSTSEITDICTALKLLSEKQKMPVFIATSTMVMQSPEDCGDLNQQLQCLLDTKIANLQQHLGNILQKHNDQSSKNHDRVISKAEVGQKKIDEVLGKLNTIDDNIVNTKVLVETPLQQTLATTSNELPTVTLNQSNQRHFPSSDVHLTQDNPKLRPNSTIDLVIKGLGVDVTGKNLSEFLQSKGVNTRDCNLLTTFDNARSLAYKITIVADDKDVVCDPSLWPENVVIQSYKQRRRNSASYSKKSTIGNRNARFANDVDHRNKRSVVNNLGKLSVRFENTDTQNSQYGHIFGDCN